MKLIAEYNDSNLQSYITEDKKGKQGKSSGAKMLKKKIVSKKAKKSSGGYGY